MNSSGSQDLSMALDAYLFEGYGYRSSMHAHMVCSKCSERFVAWRPPYTFCENPLWAQLSGSTHPEPKLSTTDTEHKNTTHKLMGTACATLKKSSLHLQQTIIWACMLLLCPIFQVSRHHQRNRKILRITLWSKSCKITHFQKRIYI